ncbi:MAG: hypothetical protein K6G56_05785 [Clostridiales bacterium]|nr:hypothetical protein [Clostridiales bacterium]
MKRFEGRPKGNGVALWASPCFCHGRSCAAWNARLPHGSRREFRASGGWSKSKATGGLASEEEQPAPSESQRAKTESLLLQDSGLNSEFLQSKNSVVSLNQAGSEQCCGETGVQNLSSSATKETSFVYHGKRRFFLHFGQKSGKIKQIGLRSGRSAASEPYFCFQGPKTGKKSGVLFTFLSSVKKRKKC